MANWSDHMRRAWIGKGGGVGGKKDAAQNTFTKLIENFKTGHISGPRGMNKNGKVANPTPLACPPFWTFSKITVHRCYWFLAWITSYIQSAALDRALFKAIPTSNWTLIIVISVSVISSNCVALFHWFTKPAPPSQPIRCIVFSRPYDDFRFGLCHSVKICSNLILN